MYSKLLAQQVISKALELLSNPDNWTTGALARGKITNKHIQPLGDETPPWMLNAIKWSLPGAIQKFAIESGNYIYQSQIELEIEKECRQRLLKYNDNSTHIQIINILKRLLLI